MVERAGIEQRVTPRVLRHTAAARMLRAVGDVHCVQDFLAHSDVSTTEVYTEVLAQDLAEAVDALPDVEAEEKRAKPTEPEDLAAQVLAALPASVREALASLIAEK